MVLYHTHHTKTIISLFAHAYKPGILCACRPGLTGWPRPINIPGYLYPTSHLVWQQNRGAWSPPRTRLTIACITSLSPWVHIQNTTEVNGELVNRAVVDQPAATSIWPSKGGDNWLLSSRYRGSPVALLFGCNWHLSYLMYIRILLMDATQWYHSNICDIDW